MNLPSWALVKATSSDREVAKRAFETRAVNIVIKERGSLRKWMKRKGWKRSWLLLEESFYKRLFESDENYTLALDENIVEIHIPKADYQITEEELHSMDEEYDTRSWSALVESLREIRRAVEAGVIIEVDGKTLKSWNEWYTWAHARYHLLEESSDKWIGDDR